MFKRYFKNMYNVNRPMTKDTFKETYTVYVLIVVILCMLTNILNLTKLMSGELFQTVQATGDAVGELESSINELIVRNAVASIISIVNIFICTIPQAIAQKNRAKIVNSNPNIPIVIAVATALGCCCCIGSVVQILYGKKLLKATEVPQNYNSIQHGQPYSPQQRNNQQQPPYNNQQQPNNNQQQPNNNQQQSPYNPPPNAPKF